MTRKKVKLAFIANDSARKATFKKRKKGLIKKVDELSTLCGIDACAIIYSPYDTQPEVWPSPLGVQRVLSKFKTMPEMEQSKKMMNQEGFVRQRIAKATEHLKKQQKENREKEAIHVMFQSLTGNLSLANLNMIDLNDLGWMIDHTMEDIDRRVEIMKESSCSRSTPYSSGHPVAAMATSSMAGPSGGAGGQASQASLQKGDMVGTNFEVNLDSMQRQQQWFMEMMNPSGGAGGQASQASSQKADMVGTNFEVNLESMQRQQQWFMEMMNPPHQETMGCGGDDMMNANALWSNAFFC